MSHPNGNNHTNGGRPPLRVPSVAEALPYSPFTSIVPFTLDVVPPPLAIPSSTPQVFGSEEQKSSAQGMLQRLDAEANGAEKASQRLNQTLLDVQHLLNANNLTQYRFNKPPRFAQTKPRPTSTSATPSKTQLGAFATMVLEKKMAQPTATTTTPAPPLKNSTPQARTNTPLPKKPVPPGPVHPLANPTASTPVTATRPPVQSQSSGSKTIAQVVIPYTPSSSAPAFQKPARPVQPPAQAPARPVQPPAQAPARPVQPPARPIQSQAQAQAPSSQTGQFPSEPSSQKSSIAIVIPKTLTDAERAQYKAYKDSEAASSKRADAVNSQRLTSASLDQQEKANTAVTRLNNLILEIFEAEDQLQPDTSGVVSSNAARYFNTEDMTDSEAPILQANVQVQLDSALHKVIANGRLLSISAEYLGRIQRLCENATTAAGTTRYPIDEDTPQELEDWTRRIAVGEQGLSACKTLLRIMTAGREEKQLYSEEALRNLLNTLTHVVETCIIPIVEMRSGGDDVDAFKIASSQSKPLLQVLSASTRVLKLLGDLIAKTDVDESAIISAEFICKTLVFVENATSEKDSALGIQRFETNRRAAMDVLAKIFARYPDQRQSIFDEILTSLEKLPVGRQSARQFKMVDAKPIQLVSALLMRLVQTSATRIRSRETSVGETEADTDEDEEARDTESSDEDAGDDSDFEGRNQQKRKHKPKAKKRKADGPDDLASLAGPLYDAALKDAHYVVSYMLSRALTSSKSGDQPYRHLLDIFTEDFLGVLGNTDWPAAEMFLRVLLQKLFDLSEAHKGPAPQKAIALELMGIMATRITELRLQSQQSARHFHSTTDKSKIAIKLMEIHEGLVADDMLEDELLAFDGPYRIVLEYLGARDNDDASLMTARGYHTVQWAKQVVKPNQGPTNSTTLQSHLAFMIKDPFWLEIEHDFSQVSTEEGRFAGVLMTLNLPFCRAFNKIFSKLLGTMTGDQASLRSKSLRSIEQLLEMDPTILDESNFVISNIIKCLADVSISVREAALGLINKCLSLRPKLDAMLYERIILRAQDTSLVVRKRAIKMLKDMYLRNNALTMKALIADTLINRVTDSDESIVELARLTFEDIWMAPFYSTSSADADAVKKKLRLREQTALVINIVKRKTETTESVLPELLQQILSDKSKAAKANFAVCTEMVKAMFDAIVDPAELPESPLQQHVLQTLTVFAAANAKLFTADQLQTLQPYVRNLSTDDNLVVYRSAIVILRHTLPHMRNLNKEFLTGIQQALFGSFQRLPPAELREVSICLWTLDGELHNTDRLVRITMSILDQVKKLSTANTHTDEAAAGKARRLITIAGHFGRAFDLDEHIPTFRTKFPEWKGNSIAALAVDLICPFTSPKQPAILRQAALESVCMLCQAWPSQLMRADVCNAFDLALKSDNSQLPFILITGLKDFFCAGDKPGESNSEVHVGTGVAAGTERLGKTYMATDRDGAATSIAQRFLRDILNVALSSADALAFNAVQMIASINRQGLVHPKEPGPCFIALETSPDSKIANIAFQEHLTLYSKHEAMFEKEHLGAIRQAFEYQRNVIKSSTGYTGSPPISKLHHFWEVLKTGKAKARLKFLTTITGKAGMGFDPSKVDLSGALPSHVAFTRFCSENLAFFDFNKFEELQHLINCVEKVMAGTGTPVAHSIDTEMLRVRLEQDAPMPSVDMINVGVMPPPPPQSNIVEPARLRELAVYAQILLLLWELRTYLRKLWNVSKHQATTAKGKANKEGARAPQRIPNPTNLTERYVARNQEIIKALDTPEGQYSICTSFSEVMAIDSELKVDKEEGDEDTMDVSMTMMNGDGYETPSEMGEAGTPNSGQKRGRKRKSVDGSTQSTPRKKGRPRKNSSVQGRSG